MHLVWLAYLLARRRGLPVHLDPVIAAMSTKLTRNSDGSAPRHGHHNGHDCCKSFPRAVLRPCRQHSLIGFWKACGLGKKQEGLRDV